LAGTLASAALLGACGGPDSSSGSTTTSTAAGSTSSTAPNFGAAASVDLKDIRFQPGTVTVKAGQEVRWLWRENIPHNVVGEGFKSATQDKGEFRHTFDKAGTYKYTCTLHSGMVGTVKVT
jgi:plastocyanin